MNIRTLFAAASIFALAALTGGCEGCPFFTRKATATCVAPATNDRGAVNDKNCFLQVSGTFRVDSNSCQDRWQCKDDRGDDVEFDERDPQCMEHGADLGASDR